MKAMNPGGGPILLLRRGLLFSETIVNNRGASTLFQWTGGRFERQLSNSTDQSRKSMTNSSRINSSQPGAFTLASAAIVKPYRSIGTSAKKGSDGKSDQHASPYETDLPSLPVPSLKRTMEQFLRLCTPLLNRKQMKETEKTVETFISSGEGAGLQELLVARSRRLPNWLTPWWLDAAYLASRSPLPILTSPGVVFPRFQQNAGDKGQAEVAAKLIASSLKYASLIERCAIPQDRAGQSPLDMSQYQLLFGTSRLPGKGKDRLVYGKDRTRQQKSHALVLRNGHAFSVPLFDEEGRPLSTTVITRLLHDAVLPTFRAAKS